MVANANAILYYYTCTEKEIKSEERMLITLHVQAQRKYFFDIQVDDEITVSELESNRLTNGRLVEAGGGRGSSGSIDITIVHMDIPLANNKRRTLKECGIKDQDHIYLHEGSFDINSNQDLIPIFIKDYRDATVVFPMDVNILITGRALSKLVANKMNIDTTTSTVQLFFGSKLLDEHRTLQNSSISTQTTLTVIIRPKV
ncbi:hypothetical protein DFA_00565 [Cavenderia fasciculata]|uniref:Ubiquitin-like domain-containing protein n=1 Tax=Cavenderia fasciculata TaxID=261658 RepID=F4PSL2_CACFS|nr:uncharacterized protein DFA_00565 [Cavenderia fasciculata]EGG20704.1 hypothetical protein DFA_00565 [Cavenderia fasciculata]|eukprot:XP_004358554.1 hypothetical protein DFA_00565 [Cavenderia fasciculata]